MRASVRTYVPNANQVLGVVAAAAATIAIAVACLRSSAGAWPGLDPGI